MRTALVISTYNRPDFLRLVLKSVRQQTRLPDQVVIADDGSTSDTCQLIDDFQSTVPFQVTHCWQPDLGFQKTRILNKAVVAAECDYLILSDGDMLLHDRYVSDHIDLAIPCRYTQGRRICLNASATTRQLRRSCVRVGIHQPGVNRRPQMIRSRTLMKVFSSVNQSLKNSRGCNQAFWRDDLLAINGYEEGMHGWGREDSELCARLHNLGRKRIYARHYALAYHLYHPELSRDRDTENQRMLDETVRTGKIQATEGLQKTKVA